MMDRFIAVFMALLVVSMPFTISEVFAQTPSGEFISVTSAQGSDGYEGFRKGTDRMSITVLASLGPEKQVQPSDIVLYVGGTPRGAFTSCAVMDQQQGIFECRYTESEQSIASFQSIEYRAVLYDGTTQIASHGKQVTADREAPAITLSLQPHVSETSAPNVTVNFRVDEFLGGRQGIGIRSASVRIGTNTVYEFSDSAGVYDPYTVYQTLTEDIVVPLPRSTGEYQICAKATDFLNNEREVCIPIRVNLNAPRFEPQTFQIMDSNTNAPLDWVSNAAVSFVASIVVSSDNFGGQVTNKVRGNFSSMNSAYASVAPSYCDPLGDNRYNCSFSVHNALLEQRSYPLTFVAEDVLGNTGTFPRSVSIRKDTDGPEPYNFRTSHGNNKAGTAPINISINIREDGVGLHNRNIFLDLSSIGGGARVQADNCTGNWDCNWYNVNVNPTSGLPVHRILDPNPRYEEMPEFIELPAVNATLRITADSTDDIGNPAVSTPFSLIIDQKPPELVDINITIIPNTDGPQEIRGETVVGDAIHIITYLNDASPVSMHVRADDFYDGSYENTFECQQINVSTHRCTAQLSPIQEEGYYDGELQIRFTDSLGNQAPLVRHSIEVFSILEHEPEYWSASMVACSPNPLDRELASKRGFTYDVYCQIKLDKLQDNAEVFDITGGRCTDITGGDSNTLTGANWMGLTRRTEHAFVNLKLGGFNPHIDNLVYNCELHVRTLLDGNNRAITRNYEAVNVTLTLGLANSPIGEISNSLFKEIEGLYDDYVDNRALGVVSYLNSFFQLSSELCRLWQMLESVFTAFRLTSHLLHSTGTTLKGTVITQPAGQSMQSVSASTDSTIQGLHTKAKATWRQYIHWYCAFASCKLGMPGRLGTFQDVCIGAFSAVSNPLLLISPDIAEVIQTAQQAALPSYDRSTGSVPGDDPGDTPAEEQESLSLYERFKAVGEARRTDGTEVRRLEVLEGHMKQGRTNLESMNAQTQAAVGIDPTPGGEGRTSRYATEQIESLPTAEQRAAAQEFNRRQEGIDRATGRINDLGSGIEAAEQTSRDSRILSTLDESFGIISPPVSPHENYIMAVCTLCVPAILYNIEKYRQMKCELGNCLLSTAAGSVPIEVCRSNYAFAKCKYFMGPVFQMIPFADFLTQAGRAIASVMANPWVALEVAAGALCHTSIGAKQVCSPTPDGCVAHGWAVNLCLINDVAGLFFSIYNDIRGIAESERMFQTEFGSSTAMCGRFQDNYEQFLRDN